MSFESRSSRLSFFGRFADELTRDGISKGGFQVSLNGSAQKIQYKDDGYFVLSDLRSSPPPFVFEATSPFYQSKTFSGALPVNAIAELTFPGEDELFVISTTVDVAQNRVNFGNIAFLAPVPKGGVVRGPGGFSATLTEALEGNDVGFALLSSVSGLNDGDGLRFVRSTRMLLRPGPCYQFPAATTLLALKIVENTPGAEPIANAQIQIIRVNAFPVNTAIVGGLSLNRVDLPGANPGDPAIQVLLGTAAAVNARSNSRGQAVFYYPESTPITALTVSISKAGYVTTMVTAVLIPSRRTQQTIPLPRV